MSDILLADIGGTTSRFAVLGADGRPDRVTALRGDDHGTLEDAVARFMDLTGIAPRAAVLGVAGPIEGDVIALTNRSWCFHLSEVARRFGLRSIRAVNDFEAIAWSLYVLGEEDVRHLGPPRPGLPGAKVVFGPGTGLGVAALVPAGSGWAVAPSEGGHASFGPGQEDEYPIFARLRAAHGFVSAETTISGPGLERLDRAMHPAGEPRSARELLAAMTAGEGTACATLAMFVRLMGRYAGDLALGFKGFSGVFLAGGVAQRLGPLLDAELFRSAFEHHPPYEHLLRATPSALITAQEPGLIGCAALARHFAD